jgi:cell division protein FtsI (penicillin-binding protein 3)
VRMLAIGALLLGCLAALLGRAAQLQITQGSRLARLAREQYLLKVAVTGKRGNIIDRSGAVLAASAPVESVYADLSQLDDPRALRTLAEALHLGPREVESLSRRFNLSAQFAWVKRQVSPAEGDAVRKLEIPGVGMVKESRRFYPERELAAQLLGLVGVDGEGLEGLEKRYDEQLRGRSAEVTASRDARGRELSADAPNAPELAGSSIQLTVDRNLQYAAEEALARGLTTTHANGGVAAILDPDTGAILALAVGPSFNPNAVVEHDRDAVRDRAVADAFEPGSTFKAFLVAAAIEEKLVSPQTILFAENGAFQVDDRTIHDHKPYGWLSVPQILQVSSNIGASKIGLLLGRERLARYLHDFGFGQRTDVGLPGELRGDLPKLRSDIATATASFGQGLTATPLQLMQGYVALANGGRLLRPYLVARVTAPDGSGVEYGPTEIRRVVSTQTAQTVTAMLEKVVEKGGTAVDGAVEGYRVAGKTGTAQKVDPLTGTYSADKRFSSFVGYLPADAPRVVIGVFLDEPKGEVYGGKIAAPIFRDLAAETMRQMGILPVHGAPAQAVAMAVDRNRKLTGPIPSPPPASAALADDSSEDDDVPENAPGGGGVPRVVGLPLRAALNALRAAGLSGVPAGSGLVVAQRPPAGGVLPQNRVVALTLASAGSPLGAAVEP